MKEKKSIKVEKYRYSVLEKGPVGSKVLERNVCVSNSEIKAEKEQSDHEAFPGLAKDKTMVTIVIVIVIMMTIMSMAIIMQ